MMKLMAFPASLSFVCANEKRLMTETYFSIRLCLHIRHRHGDRSCDIVSPVYNVKGAFENAVTHRDSYFRVKEFHVHNDIYKRF